MKQLQISALMLTLALCLQINDANGNIDYLLQKSGIQKTFFNFQAANNGKQLVTDWDDKARGILILLKQLQLNYSKKNWRNLYHLSWKDGQLQQPQKVEDFPCQLNNTRSPITPSTVDQLRPGDIDVIAALGDSMSAGNSLFSIMGENTLAEFRGMAFTAGGMADWRTFMTLPNILKIFNPDLYGYATDNVPTTAKESHLNLAESALMSRDLVYQAHLLIQRMRQDPHIDMNRHWKLVTIFVGNLDICLDMCHHESALDFLQRHEADLRRTFTVLRDNIPRLVVNLIPALNMLKTLGEMQGKPLRCQFIHAGACGCVLNKGYSSEDIRTVSDTIKRWQQLDEYVASLSEFQTQDFAVLYQPFMANATLPILRNGNSDFRYLTNDCLHFSQIGQATMANMLWNNMLQAPGEKQSKFMQLFERFECPTAERPFIATYRNSFRYGI